MSLCIRNGWILNPESNRLEKKDLRIEDGKIVEILEAGQLLGCGCEGGKGSADCVEIDAEGKWVVPGLIDLHVHFREPGFEYKEDTKTGCAAAARGGFTTVCCMPNTKPAIDEVSVVEYVNGKAAEANGVHVLPVGAITRSQSGGELTDFAAMKEAGICALSEDGKSVMDAKLMRTAMEQAAELGLPIFSHTEDMELAAGGAMNEGEVSGRLGIPGIPAEAEEIIAIRDMLLTKTTGCRMHLCHISTKGSLELIRLAKSWGLPVTAETAPHYFTLDDSAVEEERLTGSQAAGNPNKKMNPPLRGKADVEAMKIALKDGTIDAIATDHAPHSAEEKAKPFVSAPFGVVGLETSFAVSYTQLVKTGLLTPAELIDRMSSGPARILGLDKGVIAEGKAADLAVIDVEKEFVIDPEQFASKGKNSAFSGMKVFGEVVCTIADGKLIYGPHFTKGMEKDDD